MNDVSVFGAGAFGTALAISLAKGGRSVSLFARGPDHADAMSRARCNEQRLAGFAFPPGLSVADPDELVAQTCLIAVPTQKLGAFLKANTARLNGQTLIACCKGVDVATGLGPTALIRKHCPDSFAGILSGPSFAVDIAAGLPTALTLATNDTDVSVTLQETLSTRNLRLYRTNDVIGVELGGALKNVVAIAAGVTIGAGLGESARAAIITRGYAEMTRFAVHSGARAETLAGLSGLGDLVLTCTSEKSRNYGFGLAIGAGSTPAKGVTVEGAATAKAVSNAGNMREIDMPLTQTIAKLLDGDLTVTQAIESLLSRPLKKE